MRACCSLAAFVVLIAQCAGGTVIVDAPTVAVSDAATAGAEGKADDVFILPGPDGDCRWGANGWCGYTRDHCDANVYECFVTIYTACIEANRGVVDIDDCTLGICLGAIGVYGCTLPGEQCYWLTRRYDSGKWADICD